MAKITCGLALDCIKRLKDGHMLMGGAGSQGFVRLVSRELDLLMPADWEGEKLFISLPFKLAKTAWETLGSSFEVVREGTRLSFRSGQIELKLSPVPEIPSMLTWGKKQAVIECDAAKLKRAFDVIAAYASFESSRYTGSGSMLPFAIEIREGLRTYFAQSNGAYLVEVEGEPSDQSDPLTLSAEFAPILAHLCAVAETVLVEIRKPVVAFAFYPANLVATILTLHQRVADPAKLEAKAVGPTEICKGDELKQALEALPVGSNVVWVTKAGSVVSLQTSDSEIEATYQFQTDSSLDGQITIGVPPALTKLLNEVPDATVELDRTGPEETSAFVRIRTENVKFWIPPSLPSQPRIQSDSSSEGSNEETPKTK